LIKKSDLCSYFLDLKKPYWFVPSLEKKGKDFYEIIVKGQLLSERVKS
jgi:hypothetical protein